MAQLFADAARAELAVGISATDTSFSVTRGSVLPNANLGTGTPTVNATGDWFKAVLVDTDNIEIVYVRTHMTATTPNAVSNVMRGREGTTARAWPANTVLGLRWTAADAAYVANMDASPHTWAGTHTFNGYVINSGGHISTNVRGGTFDISHHVENTSPASAVAAGIFRVTSTNSVANNLLILCGSTAGDVFSVGSDGWVRAMNFRCSGDSQFYWSSDERLKKNIKPIPNALEKVRRIGGYEFDWIEKKHRDHEHDIGTVAQLVHAVFPEAVTVREDGTLAVDYPKLVAPLLQSTVELADQVDAQAKAIAELQAAVKSLQESK